MKQSITLKLRCIILTVAFVLAFGQAQKSQRSDVLTSEKSSPTDSIDMRDRQAPDLTEEPNAVSRSHLSPSRGTARTIVTKKRRQRRGRRRGAPKREDASADILRDTMIHMLGFSHMPSGKMPCGGGGLDCGRSSMQSPVTSRSSRAGGRRSVDQQFKPNPPNFMLELYRAYSEDDDLVKLHLESQGNTVRSFFPSPANPSHRGSNFRTSVDITPVPLSATGQAPTPAFLFDVTSIPTVEDLVAAEIRMDGDAPDPHATEVVAAVYRLRRTECVDCSEAQRKVFNKIGKSLFLTSLSGANIWSDPRLVKLAQKARKPDHTVVLKFRAHADTGLLQRRRRHSEAETLFDDLPQSFVTQAAESVKRSKREPNTSPLLDSTHNYETAAVMPVLIVYCNDSRAEASTETPTAAPVLWQALGNMTSPTRRKVKRSAELPEGSLIDDGAAAQNASSTKRPRKVSTRDTPFVVDTRKGNSKRRKKGKQATSEGETATDEDLAQKKGKNRGGRRGGRRRKNRKNRKMGVRLHPSLVMDHGDDSCGRKSLHVKFEDIGWSDWIISPEYFDAYYCTGMCKLSQMQESGAGTTNHAIIQTVVKSITGNEYVPSACCVPDKLMSLSVLFFDEDRNVVLKVFSNMSVKTCACR